MVFFSLEFVIKFSILLLDVLNLFMSLIFFLIFCSTFLTDSKGSDENNFLLDIKSFLTFTFAITSRQTFREMNLYMCDKA